MKRIACFVLLLLAGAASAADDPKAQIEVLNIALQAAREQRNAAQDQLINVAVMLAQAQKRVAELEDAAAKKAGGSKIEKQN